jgi:hypothetical protein
VDDPEHVENPIFGDQVVHDSVVPNAQAVEGVGCAPDRAYPLAADPARHRRVGRQLLQALPDPSPNRSRQLLVRARGGGRKQDRVGLAQPSS